MAKLAQICIDGDCSDTLQIDASLSVAGYAADARATGQALAGKAPMSAVGGPNIAATASAMTDTNKIYVYTGNESGYSNGHWYYYDGTSWVDGGVYQAAAVNTDTTLTQSGVPADAKATGDEISQLKNDLTADEKTINTLSLEMYNIPNITPSDWEIGGIYIPADEAWSYSWSNKLVRTKQGFQYTVHKGDVIYLSDYTNAKFSIGVTNGTNYHRSLNKTSGQYTVAMDGVAVITVGYQDEQVITNVSDLVSRLRFASSGGLKDTIENTIEDVGSITDRVVNLEYANGYVFPDAKDYEIGSIYVANSSDIQYQYNTKRIRTKEGFWYHLPAGTCISLNAASGYRFGVYTKINNTYSDSGWKTEYYVPQDADIALSISANPEVTVTDVSDYVGLIKITLKKPNYGYTGEAISIKDNQYVLFGEFEVPSVADINALGFDVTTYQSLAAYGSYFLVGYSNDVLAFVSAETHELITAVNADVGHANEMSFSNVFYDENDILPLLYVTKTINSGSNEVSVIRIASTSSVSTIKTITFEGNYAAFAIDNATGYAVVVSYYGASQYAASGNYMIAKKYDITGDTPVLLQTNNIPFIPVMQDAEIKNGSMFICSYGVGATPPVSNKIYVIDVGTLSIRNILTEFDNYYANVNEPEGLTVFNGCLYTNASRLVRRIEFA